MESYICESNRNEISQKMSSLIKSNQWSAPSSDSLSCNSRSATAPRLFRNPCFRYSVHSWLFVLEKTSCWFLTLTRFFDASCQNKSVALLQGDQMAKTLFRHNQQNWVASFFIARAKLSGTSLSGNCQAGGDERQNRDPPSLSNCNAQW